MFCVRFLSDLQVILDKKIEVYIGSETYLVYLLGGGFNCIPDRPCRANKGSISFFHLFYIFRYHNFDAFKNIRDNAQFKCREGNGIL